MVLWDGTMRATLAVLAVLASASQFVQAEGTSAIVPPDATNAEQAVFATHLMVGRFRMNTRLVAHLPDAVYPALRDWRIKDAGQILFEAGRAGSLDAYDALHILGTPCWSGDFSQHHASRRERERPGAFERAKILQLDAAALERLDWAFEADAKADARVRAELCPDGENLFEKWDAEARKARDALDPGPPPEIEEKLRNATPEERAALIQPHFEEAQRRLSKAGSTEARLFEIDNLLASEDPKVRSQGLRLLRELATWSSIAKVTLARCIREQCAPGAGENSEVLKLILSAARDGNETALSSLADVQYDLSAPRSPLGLPASERYAWATVTRELMTDGCFGTNYFIAWMTTSPERLGLNLLEMPPGEAERARARAKQMATSETPRIREALTCNQFDAEMASSPR